MKGMEVTERGCVVICVISPLVFTFQVPTSCVFFRDAVQAIHLYGVLLSGFFLFRGNISGGTDGSQNGSAIQTLTERSIFDSYLVDNSFIGFDPVQVLEIPSFKQVATP